MLIPRTVSLSGAVFVDRKNRKDAVQAMNIAGEDMKKQGVSVNRFFSFGNGGLMCILGLVVDLPRGNTEQQARAWAIAVQEGRLPSGCSRCVLRGFGVRVKEAERTLGSIAGVPIIPVVCESYHRLFDGKTRMERGVLKVKGTRTASHHSKD